MLQFPFYLLFFLNFFPPILSTNPPCKFVLNEINEFNKEFKDNLEIFNQKIVEIGGRRKVQEILGHRFSEAIFRNEFPGEIGKMKIEVEKYLRGNKPFREIFNEINGMRMENEKLKELEMLKSELDEAKREHHILLISTQKTLELVEMLGGMHVSVNKLIAETFVKLQTRQMMEHFDELGRQIQQQKIILGAPYAKIVGKYGPESFAKIAEIIKREKNELLEEYWNPNPPLPETIFKNKNKLPAKCTQNMDKLRSAFDEKNPLLEKVELNVPGPNISLAPDISQLNEHLQKIGKYLDNAVNELPQMIEQEPFFAEKQQEFANLHAQLDDLQFLNIAFIQMYNRIRQVVFFEVWEKQLFARLTDIHWLKEYIAEKLDQMNTEVEERHRRPFLSVAEAREKQELPKELEFEGKEMNDPREVAFLIGENLLFIAAQMGRMHNFKDAIETMYFEKPMESHKDVRLLAMVNVKNLPPQQIGKFFYEKYLEKIKKGEIGGDKLSEGMGKMKIGEEASSSKSGHAAVGESSSTKIGGNGEGDEEKNEKEGN